MVQMERSSSRARSLRASASARSRAASSCIALALRPAWGRTLAWIGDKIWKPQVKKMGIEKLE
jgi:hypothetical protein